MKNLLRPTAILGLTIQKQGTCIGNLLNMCGLSIPCGFTKEGLPIGLMIYSKLFQEDVVLRVGYAFQQMTDWHKRSPDLSWAVDTLEE